MKNDNGNLSIDFLAGFTVFMIAFIWIATMIPGLLLGLTGRAIDYDAVAYRTGVILVEDPGMPVNPPWENKQDVQKDEIVRMGFSLTKDTPNLLSSVKVNRFFCSTVFTYPDDYQEKVIFGDLSYRFNISVRSFDNRIDLSVGDIKPVGFGYIRRFVKIKQMSNATIDPGMYTDQPMVACPVIPPPSITNIFSVRLNMTRLLYEEKRPPYQIDALREPITINITNIRSGLTNPNTQIQLTSIRMFRLNPATPLSPVPPNQRAYIDGSLAPIAPPVIVTNNISVNFTAGFFSAMATDQSQMFINFTFDLTNNCPGGDRFLNSTHENRVYDYDYNYTRVTQPEMVPAVVEVAVW
jgi:hypothetical protein